MYTLAGEWFPTAQAAPPHRRALGLTLNGVLPAQGLSALSCCCLVVNRHRHLTPYTELPLRIASSLSGAKPSGVYALVPRYDILDDRALRLGWEEQPCLFTSVVRSRPLFPRC